MLLINPFTSNKKLGIIKHYDVNSAPVYVNGDYSVFTHSFRNSYLYVYKGVVVNELVGLNKTHIDNLANNERPINGFLFDRAKETYANWIK